MHKKDPCHFTSSSKWCFLGTHAGPKEGHKIRRGAEQVVMWWAFCPSPFGIGLMGMLKFGRAWLPIIPPPSPSSDSPTLVNEGKKIERSRGSSRVVICKTSFSCRRCLPLSLALRNLNCKMKHKDIPLIIFYVGTYIDLRFFFKLFR